MKARLYSFVVSYFFIDRNLFKYFSVARKLQTFNRAMVIICQLFNSTTQNVAPRRPLCEQDVGPSAALVLLHTMLPLYTNPNQYLVQFYCFAVPLAGETLDASNYRSEHQLKIAKNTPHKIVDAVCSINSISKTVNYQ